MYCVAKGGITTALGRVKEDINEVWNVPIQARVKT
jgi:hypothetical protein